MELKNVFMLFFFVFVLKLDLWLNFSMVFYASWIYVWFLVIQTGLDLHACFKVATLFRDESMTVKNFFFKISI